MAKVLLLTSSPVAEGATVKSIADQHSVSIDGVHIISNAGAAVNYVQSTYPIAISIADSATFHTTAYLSAVAKLLQPGATLQLQQPATPEGVSVDQIKHNLVLSGFTDVQPVGTVPGLVLLRACLPSWGLGSKAALPLKAKQAAAALKPTAWAVTADDDDDELLDDDALLTEADLQRPAAQPKADDCEVGAGRKACKDCTCGRADAEAAGEKVVLTQEMLDNPQSSCGNCSLGDAFRCAGCPYRGLPAFEPGKKIQLAASFLTADA